MSGPPVSNGAVVLENDRILAVQDSVWLERQPPGSAAQEYGHAVITPGLINLHTHLDYTNLRFTDTESSLLAWIRGLLGRASRWTSEQWQASAAAGAREVALSGTSCIADSSYTGAAATAAAGIGLRATVGLELFGVNSSGVERAWASWLEKLGSLESSSDRLLKESISAGRVRLTVAPHAPYSVCPALWRRALEWSAQRGLPVFVHLAESEHEHRWIASGDPDLDAFLAAVVPGPLEPFEWKGHGLSPVEHLEHHGLLAPNTVAAHCVRLGDRDIELLRGSRLKVAHCPRSNARLRNGYAPVSRLIAAGVPVGFGTDSAASNDDLDLLAEARFGWNLLRAIDPGSTVRWQDVVHMLTLGAAGALGIESQVGSLEAGKKADIAVFSLADGALTDAASPYDLLLHGTCTLRDLFVDGQQIVKDGSLHGAARASH
ncbi:MAG TPA: amidohydrolase family protein [Candidatus Obscuribacterales bacterium]